VFIKRHLYSYESTEVCITHSCVSTWTVICEIYQLGQRLCMCHIQQQTCQDYSGIFDTQLALTLLSSHWTCVQYLLFWHTFLDLETSKSIRLPVHCAIVGSTYLTICKLCKFKLCKLCMLMWRTRILNYTWSAPLLLSMSLVNPVLLHIRVLINTLSPIPLCNAYYACPACWNLFGL